MKNLDSNTLTFENFLELVPYEHRDMHSGPDEDMIIQFIHDLDFLHRGVSNKTINKDEIFVLINQDFTISVKKFLKSYNMTLGKQFPLQFLLNYTIECKVGRDHVYVFLIAPRTHINYFKLVNEVPGINIHSLDVALKQDMPNFYSGDYSQYQSDKLYSKYESLVHDLNDLKDKQSVKLLQTLTF